MVDDKKVKDEKKDYYEVVEVSTQTASMIREVSTGIIKDNQSLLLEIANSLRRIEKAVVG